MIHAAIACNLDSNILRASLPLFESSEVQAIEWSFDTLYNYRNIPEWFIELLDAFGSEGRLIGHGVFFSVFSAKFSEAQEKWLVDLRKKSKRFNFDHITEHFGFMTGEDFHKGAPVSIPLNSIALQIGQDRLKRLSDACQKPVGLENLALAYSLEDVQQQGAFISKVLQPVNGFIILDLHNLYCQCHNFDIDFRKLLDSYDLSSVREIHISGGSWEESNFSKEKIRRDTHDDVVPQEVFDMLKYVIPLCENLKFVVLEQLGTGLKTLEKQIQFQQDFKVLKSILSTLEPTHIKSSKSFLPQLIDLESKAYEHEGFYTEQNTMTQILETAQSVDHAKQMLNNSVLKNSDWDINTWEDHMLDTAISIAQKWK